MEMRRVYSLRTSRFSGKVALLLPVAIELFTANLVDFSKIDFRKTLEICQSIFLGF
jgi:hypothetical protein